MQLIPHLNLMLFAYRDAAYSLKWDAASFWHRGSKRQQHKNLQVMGVLSWLGQSIPASSLFSQPSQISAPD